MTLLDSPTLDNPFTQARKAMIDSQLRTSGVTEPFAVSRMGEVAREDFVPKAAQGFAYMDRAIDLGDGKYLAAPLTQGMMLQEAKPAKDDDVIVVDGGSGYLAELLRPLVGSLKVLSAQEAIAKSRGSKKADLIVIDGAIEQMPDALARRLAENGRVVTGLVHDGITSVATGCKAGKEVAFMPVLEIGIPRLAEFDKPKGWSF